MSMSILSDGYNAGYVQEIYERYTLNPASVSDEWRRLFSENLDDLVAQGLVIAEDRRRNGRPALPLTPVAPVHEAGADTVPGLDQTMLAEVAKDRLLPQIARAAALIQAFRDHGHQLANIDPLGSEPPGHPQLDPGFFGIPLDMLDDIPTSLILEDGGDVPLSRTLQRLRDSYCGSTGFQFEHLEDPEKVRWLWNEVESGKHSAPMSREEKAAVLQRLSEVEGLEQFLHRTYLGQKRFSLEGNDMLVPMLDLAITETARTGGRQVVLGMAHRGRLNVLAHIVGISYRYLIREFEGAPQEEEAPPWLLEAGMGDVKYHHGAKGTYSVGSGADVEVNLAPNPSHLEFVNPVVGGMARALQQVNEERDEASVVPVLIHGDAAFGGEGVVAESLNLARLDGYRVGGTVHIIVNNQVGFTTNPDDGRSTRYASDVAKGYDIPVIHVNGDDPEACLSAMRLAMAYRTTYRDDIVIDLVGYRRHGHNEGDEPAYTQPTQYEKISDHPTVRQIWAQKLIEDGTVEEREVDAAQDHVIEILRGAQATVMAEKDGREHDPFPPPPDEPERLETETATDLATLEKVNMGALAVPEGFTVHPKLKRQLDRRRKEFGMNTSLDWAWAEALAFGSLLKQGVPVRITGQDSERGTFSQRHLVLHDARTGRRTTPLGSVGKARFEIHNSPLSEAAVLGFEYGYSVASESDFVLWEAQFGDFVNAAQVTIDQFIASGRTKWGQLSSLTLLLPHGYEGQGPEHSSARLERFLQLCAEDNMRVAYPTTPGQYFHLLRRQALAMPRRPLVVMTPKSLLRHPRATSTVRGLVEGHFQPVVPDPVTEGRDDEVTRLVLCAGKFYYDLLTAEGREERIDLSVARVEELYPFPTGDLEALVARYPNLEEVVWAQEEPRNMGALTFVGPRLRAVVPRHVPLRHVARQERASPAEGRPAAHDAGQRKLVRDVFGDGE
ncbi:MAG: 2-oxoglutarate dehydrogenase E1 component [Gemmatimonadales bacterium]|nr:MAG: 2-oxoglutarate dehydrogenase E1 component [Gemmatimonadales bacterium]